MNPLEVSEIIEAYRPIIYMVAFLAKLEPAPIKPLPG